MLRVHQLLKQHSGGVQINPWDLWTGFKMFIDSLKKSQTDRHKFQEETPLPLAPLALPEGKHWGNAL